MDKEIKQRDIYMCNLRGIDSEYRGVHPCLVVSANIINESSSKVTIVPITHQNKRRQPTHYYLFRDKYDFLLYDKNTILGEEINTVSKSRLMNKLGSVKFRDFIYIKRRLGFIFDYSFHKELDNSQD